jgi:hypothetical protein
MKIIKHKISKAKLSNLPIFYRFVLNNKVESTYDDIMIYKCDSLKSYSSYSRPEKLMSLIIDYSEVNEKKTFK